MTLLKDPGKMLLLIFILLITLIIIVMVKHHDKEARNLQIKNATVISTINV